MPNRVVLIIACLIAFPAVAQQGQRPSWLPKSVPEERDFAFANLSFAKISEDKKTVQFVRPALQYVDSVREVQKTVMTTQTRTKTVSEGGEEKTITYTIQVPQTTTEMQTYRVPVVASNFPERFNVAIEKISAWDLAGNAIDGATLATRLQKAAYVLAKEEDPKNFFPMDSFYASALRSDLIVIYLPSGTFPSPKPIAPHTPPTPAPFAPAPSAPPAPIVDPSR